jgi:hypothetical protein
LESRTPIRKPAASPPSTQPKWADGTPRSHLWRLFDPAPSGSTFAGIHFEPVFVWARLSPRTIISAPCVLEPLGYEEVRQKNHECKRAIQNVMWPSVLNPFGMHRTGLGPPGLGWDCHAHAAGFLHVFEPLL